MCTYTAPRTFTYSGLIHFTLLWGEVELSSGSSQSDMLGVWCVQELQAKMCVDKDQMYRKGMQTHKSWSHAKGKGTCKILCYNMIYFFLWSWNSISLTWFYPFFSSFLEPLPSQRSPPNTLAHIKSVFSSQIGYFAFVSEQMFGK